MFRTGDTIAAVSTPAGHARLAIVRMSGPDSAPIASRIFEPVDPRTVVERMAGFRAAEGLVWFEGFRLPASLYCFRAPRSYTREDVVEIHMPGSPAAAGSVLDRIISLGARQAEAGEFTARAFFSGRIDLSQAQAVADIVNAADEGRMRAGIAALDGRINRLCGDISSELTGHLASIEASIDLAEEDISPAGPGEVAAALEQAASGLEQFARSARAIPDSPEIPQVALAGRANTGKSSLVNAISDTERSITSSLAGTTRDVLRTPLALPCGAVIDLLDVAGILQGRGEDSLPGARAEQAARRAIARADIILFVTEARAPDPDTDGRILEEARAVNSRAPILALANKVDLDGGRVEIRAPEGVPVFYTSAVTGEGLDEVRAALTETLHLSTDRPADALGLHDRQRRSLERAAGSVRQCASLLSKCSRLADSAEIAAVELRSALASIGEVSGRAVTEEVLGAIFSRFCVGK